MPPTFFIPEHEDIVMEFVKIRDPPVSKPIMIAAMQDMGNIGNIAIDFLNEFEDYTTPISSELPASRLRILI
ncbi:MAG: hypothetical protein ACREAZ_08190 [Nitrososphaera sp.]